MKRGYWASKHITSSETAARVFVNETAVAVLGRMSRGIGSGPEQKMHGRDAGMVSWPRVFVSPSPFVMMKTFVSSSLV